MSKGDEANGSFTRAMVRFLGNQHIPFLWPQGLVPDGPVTKARPMKLKLGAFS